jgi:glycopeptide antibiotics resistance protein
MLNSKIVKYLFVAYFLIIILLVVLPLNTATSLNTITVISFRGDYFFHALAFSVWALFGQIMQKRQLSWFLIGLAFATITEGLQYMLPYRAFNVNDLIANVIGIVVGFTIINPVFRLLLRYRASS